jgi:phospholipase C
VVVIVGENRSFDHLFATYVARRGETVWNLLSKGIITAEGTPGPHFGPAKQYKGVLKAPSKFSLVPTSKTPYETLPPPNTDGTPSVADDSNPPPFSTLAFATVAAGNLHVPARLRLAVTGRQRPAAVRSSSWGLRPKNHVCRCPRRNGAGSRRRL